jgi:hypothetical protein
MVDQTQTNTHYHQKLKLYNKYMLNLNCYLNHVPLHQSSSKNMANNSMTASSP